MIGKAQKNTKVMMQGENVGSSVNMANNIFSKSPDSSPKPTKWAFMCQALG